MIAHLNKFDLNKSLLYVCELIKHRKKDYPSSKVEIHIAKTIDDTFDILVSVDVPNALPNDLIKLPRAERKGDIYHLVSDENKNLFKVTGRPYMHYSGYFSLIHKYVL